MNMKSFRFLVLKKKSLLIAGTALLCITALYLAVNLLSGDSQTAVAGAADDYVILSMNDLGMHCMQEDYSSYLILPPANTLKVQVFKKGNREAELITGGITVRYEMIDNTTSANKNNFWKYSKDYGYDVPPNIGITGNGLSGECKLSADKKYFEATAIPVVPYNDGSSKINPYQLAKITVMDKKTGKVLAETSNTVIPVSTEMDCAACHGKENTDADILKTHDKLSKTHLYKDLQQGKRYKCADCHADAAIGEQGISGVLPFSQAMHGFHTDKMAGQTEPVCYSCHPGQLTLCYRGIMYANGVKCDDKRCHGDMANIAQSQKEGRVAWVNEPDCAACHGDKYSVNKNKLYRNSYLLNPPNKAMKGLILCASCHNAPHAEWKSTLKVDNQLPLSLLGYESYINECTVCHKGKGKFHK
jgi:hypothetical protein